MFRRIAAALPGMESRDRTDPGEGWSRGSRLSISFANLIRISISFGKSSIPKARFRLTMVLIMFKYSNNDN